MTKEEREKAIDALKISAPIHALTEEEFNDYIQTLNKIMDWLEQEPILDKIKAEIEQAADKQFQIAMGIADLNERYTHIQMENAYRHSLNIIDKYRGD